MSMGPNPATGGRGSWMHNKQDLAAFLRSRREQLRWTLNSFNA
jgi:hypothetical protein